MKENIKFIQMQMGHSSAKMTLDRYGHLINDQPINFGRRLDNIMLGKSVRKLLENGNFEEIPAKEETPEVVELQELKSNSGGPLRTGKEDIVPGSRVSKRKSEFHSSL